MTINRQSITTISFMGPPLAGKNVQAEKLKEKFGDRVGIVSPGDLLRELLEDKDHLQIAKERFPELAGELEQYAKLMHDGFALPNEFVHKLVFRQVQEFLKEGKDIVIFAGFPRDYEQLQELQRRRAAGEIDHEIFVWLQLDEETANKRREVRLQEGKRKDDESSLQLHNRFETFKANNIPVIHAMEVGKEDVLTIDTARLSIDEVAYVVDDRVTALMQAFELPGKEIEGRIRGRRSHPLGRNRVTPEGQRKRKEG